LALEYFEKADALSDSLTDPDNFTTRELVVLMFSISHTHRDLILETLFAKYDATKKDNLIEFVRDCLQARPKGYDPSRIIEAWVKRAHNEPEIASILPKLLEFVSPSVEFLTWADRNLVNALAQQNRHRMETFGIILSCIQPNLLCEHVSEMLRNADDSTVTSAAELLLNAGGAYFVREFLAQNETGRTFRSMAGVLLKWKTLSGREDWWKQMCRCASDSQRAVLLGLALEHSPNLVPRVLGFQRHDRLWPLSEMRRFPDADGLLLVVDSISELMDSNSGREVLMRLGEGYFPASFLNPKFLETKVPKPSFEETAKQIYPSWIEARRKRIFYDLRGREITSEEATTREELFKRITVEQFMNTEHELIHNRMAELHRQNVTAIREFLKKNAFWSKERWISFLDAVEQETICHGVIPELWARRQISTPTSVS
jgi:hypothetical protein